MRGGYLGKDLVVLIGQFPVYSCTKPQKGQVSLTCTLYTVMERHLIKLFESDLRTHHVALGIAPCKMGIMATLTIPAVMTSAR